MDKLSPEQLRQARERAKQMEWPMCPFCGKPGRETTVHGDTERKFVGFCGHQWGESDLQETAPHMEAKETSKTPRRLGFAFFASFGLFCVTRGYSAVNASPSWLAGGGWVCAVFA